MPGLRPALRRESGFTLIETLISTVLLGVVVAMFSLLLSTTVRESGEISELTQVQGEVRAGVDAIVEDLRQAYVDDSTKAVESIGSSSITFLAPDRAQPFHLRRIVYRVQSGYLERSITTSTDTDGYPWSWPASGPYRRQFGSIANASIFSYQDANGVATAVADNVRTVVIGVTVTPRTSRGVRTFTYSTSANLRSLGVS